MIDDRTMLLRVSASLDYDTATASVAAISCAV